MARNKVRVEGTEILSAAPLSYPLTFLFAPNLGIHTRICGQLENRDPPKLTPVGVFSINCNFPSPKSQALSTTSATLPWHFANKEKSQVPRRPAF